MSLMTSWLPLALLLSVAPPSGAVSGASTCLPPGIPAIEAMNLIDRRVVSIEGARQTETYMALEYLYESTTGARYAIVRLRGAFAVVDDDPMNSSAIAWWIDPGLVTDDVPPKVQATPTSTCQWRRRGDAA